MFNHFLIPKSLLEGNGASTALALGEAAGEILQVTLVIDTIVEQQSLEVHIQGSLDGETWLEKPLAAFPQKFYIGSSVLMCDLAAHPDLRFIRASWKANRWGRGVLKPRFGVYLFAEAVASVALDSK
jgi:hypothetical protein